MRNIDLFLTSSLFHPSTNRTFGIRRNSPARRAEPRATRAVNVPVDITQSDKAYLLTADLPGVDPSTLEISVHDGQLRLKGERTATADAESSVLQRRERRTGSFERSFVLPKGVAVDDIAVQVENGVVSITIPKGEAQVRRQIEIQGYSAPVVPSAQPPTQAQSSP